jgi:hypothetical protein
MHYGGAESWNLRDTHMFETLCHLLEARGPRSKALVWAHNSHIGDARYTEMGVVREQLNIGQLCRERWRQHAKAGGGTMGGNPRKGLQVASPQDGRERLLDEAIEGTFPSSDPVAIGHSDHAGAPPDRRTSGENASAAEAPAAQGREEARSRVNAARIQYGGSANDGRSNAIWSREWEGLHRTSLPTRCEVFAFLAAPRTHGSSEPVTQIDTHGAAVFLAGSSAYKITRAVRFPFMDFSTLEKRRAACEAVEGGEERVRL